MIILPKVRGFICTTAHPSGCFENVLQQINYVKAQQGLSGSGRVLVVGASTGYGLASRISAAFGCQASTIGVSFEKAAKGKRTASAGWYNTAAFEQQAHKDGLYAKSLNGDAFSSEIKQQVIDLIKADWGQVDMVIYSLASPRRTDPTSGETYSSVLKPIGASYHNKTIDPFTSVVSEVTIDPATEQEVADTVTVMGGEDWQMWIDALRDNDLLADGFKTTAYSYIGPGLTHPIYKDGAIGMAKRHVQQTADNLNMQLSYINGSAYCAVNKAVVTQSSAAIPVVPLYIAILFKVMHELELHEDCIEQMYRLFQDYLCVATPSLDEKRRIRLDDKEMQDDVQRGVEVSWQEVSSSNIESLANLEEYKDKFLQLFGFGLASVDYTVDVDPAVSIPSIPDEA